MYGKSILVSFICFLQFTALQSWGWGQTGHEAMAMVAEAKLSLESAAAVKKLLGKSNLSDIATWADSARGQASWKHTSAYHYNDSPDGMSFLQTVKALSPEQQAKGNVVAAMMIAEDILRDSSASKAEQKYALQFLVHFLGDLHQPLHAGRPDDRGGNDIKMNWMGYSTNLHAIWDALIITNGHKDLFKGAAPDEVSEIYATYLLANLKNVTIPAGTASNYEAWFNESVAPRNTIYAKRNDEAGKYIQQFLPLIDQRVYLAGLRLAELLNRIYAEEESPSPVLQLRKALESVVGDLNEIIQLVPASLTAQSDR